MIILFFEWFYNHPALRYGGYCVISLLVFIPLAKFIENIKIDYKKYFNLSLILILISLTVFILRNINRINYEIDFYSYNFVINPSYELSSKHFRMQQNKEKLIFNYENCKTGNEKCDKSLEPKISKNYGYYIINKR